MDFTPHTDAEVAEMLRVIGVQAVDDLFRSVPEMFKITQGLALPPAQSEAEVLKTMGALAEANTGARALTFLGAGAYDHYVPAAVHHLVLRGEFLTSYTPYQPELSQGTLQAQFEYQTMVASLLGMDVANASMYEGSTGCAEAALMATRHGRRPKVAVSRAVHPQYRDVLRNYLGDANVIEVPFDGTGATDAAAAKAALAPDVACLVVQSPNFLGVVEDVQALADLAHGTGALMVSTFTEALAFGLLEAPGNLGADLAAGEGQSLGLPLSYGGPYLGYFAVKQPFVKTMPGRLIGRTKDQNGNPCFTLTLAAREQHIRRERASSNICTNEGLCALMSTVHLALLGKTGYQRLARWNHHRAEVLKARLAAKPGLSLPFAGPTFNEFVVRVPGKAAEVVARCAADGLVPGLDLGRYEPGLADCLLIAVTEMRTDADLDRLVAAL